MQWIRIFEFRMLGPGQMIELAGRFDFTIPLKCVRQRLRLVKGFFKKHIEKFYLNAIKQLVEQFRSLSTFQQTCGNTKKSTLFPFSGFANRENHPKFVLTKGQIILNGQKMGEINCNHEYYRPRDCLKYECSYNIRTREGEVE